MPQELRFHCGTKEDTICKPVGQHFLLVTIKSNDFTSQGYEVNGTKTLPIPKLSITIVHMYSVFPLNIVVRLCLFTHSL